MSYSSVEKTDFEIHCLLLNCEGISLTSQRENTPAKPKRRSFIVSNPELVQALAVISIFVNASQP